MYNTNYEGGFSLEYGERILFGERLRGKRNALGFTQEYVSEQIGITLRFYQMIERGEKSVSLDTLIRLSQTLSLSVDYLLFGNLPDSPGNPIAEILQRLSSEQREDAVKILTLYAKACGDS